MRKVALLLALALAVHVGLGLLVHDHGPLAVDRAAFDAVDPIRTASGLDVARVVTGLGAYPVIALVAVAGAVAAVRSGRPRDAVALIAGALLLLVLVDLTKQIWDRPRPATRFYDPSGQSFPSGHSAQAIAWVAAAAATGRRALILAAAAVAVTIGASRLYLHVHYMTDVLGGFALGAAVFAPVLAREPR